MTCECCGKVPATEKVFRKPTAESIKSVLFEVCLRCAQRTYHSFRQVQTARFHSKGTATSPRFLILTLSDGRSVTVDQKGVIDKGHVFYGVAKQPEDKLPSLTLSMIFNNTKRALNGVLWTKKDGCTRVWMKPQNGKGGVARIRCAVITYKAKEK